MKKSLLALAVLGAFAGTAAAQSTVTVFGVVDLSLASIKNDGTDARRSMNSNALNSNRLGFRGVEDLGGGLSARFHLEAPMANDTGNPGGLTFLRRSTVSLAGRFGEVRLGREYTPSFWNTTVFDPFGTNGVGSSLNVSNNVGAIPTYVRSNNSVGYHLPGGLGGVYGEAMFALGEGAAGKYTGGRVGFGAGPVNVALGIGNTELDAAGILKSNVVNLAGSYKIGPATLMAQWNNEKRDTSPTAEAKETRILLGANVVMGQGEIRASWNRFDNKTAGTAGNADATQLAVGYIYNLSPRTALYATYASISNDTPAQFQVSGSSAALPRPGGKSTGLEGGLRHSF